MKLLSSLYEIAATSNRDTADQLQMPPVGVLDTPNRGQSQKTSKQLATEQLQGQMEVPSQGQPQQQLDDTEFVRAQKQGQEHGNIGNKEKQLQETQSTELDEKQPSEQQDDCSRIRLNGQLENGRETRQNESEGPNFDVDLQLAKPSDISDIAEKSDEELVDLYETSPILYEFGNSKVARISERLVMKGGALMTRWEADIQKFATTKGLPVPSVHRVFSTKSCGEGDAGLDQWYMVMDFVPGSLLNDIWPDLDSDTRKTVARQVVDLIEQMQSMPLNTEPPGPIGGTNGELWQGPWFTAYGAGPFESVQEMEDWFNHKRDVGLRLRQAPPDLAPFKFKDLVLTHQDIAPRNIIFNHTSRRIWLIDWAMGGIYPVGFEQATLDRQCIDKWDIEFREAVLAELFVPCKQEISQLKGIMYGLTTGAFL